MRIHEARERLRETTTRTVEKIGEKVHQAHTTVRRIAEDPRTQRAAQVAKAYVLEVATETGKRLDAAPTPPATETGKEAVRRVATTVFESAQAVNRKKLEALATRPQAR